MKTLLISLLLLCSTQFTLGQHYSLISQYITNGLVLNPGYAGKDEALNVTVFHRRQWSGFDIDLNTTAFTAHTQFKNQHVSGGISLVNDRIGITETNNLLAIYAYRIQTGRFYTSFGLQGGLNVIHNDWDKLRKVDQADAIIPVGQTTETGFLGGTGIYMNNEKFFFGLSAPGFFNTNSLNRKINGPFFLNYGYLFDLKNGDVLKPSFLVRYSIDVPIQTDVNLSYYIRNRVGIGFSYRSNESLVGILEILPSGDYKQFKISYSYDYSINKLAQYQNGSHELSLRYIFGYDKSIKNPRALFY